jgi:hypothetical protein
MAATAEFAGEAFLRYAHPRVGRSLTSLSPRGVATIVLVVSLGSIGKGEIALRRRQQEMASRLATGA